MAGLTDRLDGVQSVASFNSQIQPLGRYREAVRFFEMAFARPITAIEKKLAQFLASGKFGYSRDEVAEWISRRHGAMHADEKPSNELVWDADVAQFMDRIDQALYDVLLNKKEWHKPSQDRRDLWQPLAGTSDDKAGVFMTQGTGGVRLEFQIFDGFKAYPHDMTASFKKIPPEWWCQFTDDSSSEPLVSGDFEIISASPADTTNSASARLPEDPHR